MGIQFELAITPIIVWANGVSVWGSKILLTNITENTSIGAVFPDLEEIFIQR